jgi:hypothetical protein
MTAVATPIPVGSKIKFAPFKRRMTVVASSKRFTICTIPFAAKKTVIYTIVDHERQVRGRDNMIFSPGYETPGQLEVNLQMLDAGEMEVSHRWGKHVPIDIERVDLPN